MQPRQQSSLPYHEPSIPTILIHSSFLLALNLANFILDRALYCGLLGQVLLGVAWGTPGAKWLGEDAERVVVRLGYLGLLLLIYEGGLSTSPRLIRANIFLSLAVATTGIALPIALSFILGPLVHATPTQCFAAGAALCSTSLGTTFTVLGTSGLASSRLGVVLTSAAMMDDVVGLVMVQVISNLGPQSASIDAVAVARPLLVSAAFAVAAPVLCVFVAKPATSWLNARRARRPAGLVNRTLQTRHAAFILHTLVLLGCVTGASYAGTSNLFAAYVAGASISWWDAEVEHFIEDGTPQSAPQAPTASETQSAATPPRADAAGHCPSSNATQQMRQSDHSGARIYDTHYREPVDKILRPFFFASIGFSIPIAEMFSGDIVWKGVIYTAVMAFGKLACGAWLLRPALPRPAFISRIRSPLLNLPRPKMSHFWGRGAGKNATNATQSSPESRAPKPATLQQPPDTPTVQSGTPADPRAAPSANPRSLYPASIVASAMVARGEIGFLISSIAESNGIFAAPSTSKSSKASSDMFLIITWAIVLCTIIGPLAVGLLVQRVKKLQRGVERQGRVVRGDVLGVWGVS